MYAIIQTGGKQYKVEEGMKLKVERLKAQEGDEIKIKEILALNDGEHLVVGNPFLPYVHVVGKVISHGKAKKVTVFRFKRRKDYKKKRGHRQPYTELLIEKIVREVKDGS